MQKIYDGYNWRFTTFDIVKEGTGTLIKEWGIPEKGALLLYTNPPFDTSSAPRLVSKKGEIDETHQSRQVKIEYGDMGDRYGRGDLILPIVGRLIEIAKKRGNCYLAFFSPMGLFCGRKRYDRLLSGLLKDFQFMFGYMFAGTSFHNINKTLPIAFTVWRYLKSANTKHKSLKFEFIKKDKPSKILSLKPMPLLKDGWRYRDGSKYVKDRTPSPLGVFRADYFDTPGLKSFAMGLKEGSGAEMSPDNVKKSIGITNVPDELFYGLWSITVGKHAFGTSLSDPMHPIYFEQTYVHLPDVSRRETLEILTYSALYSLFDNYARNKIGFFGGDRIFRFGGERLTKGVGYLLRTCGSCPVYDGKTIKDVFELLRKEPDKVDLTECRKGIKEEVSKRLEAIGYWHYVPIPMTLDRGDKEPKENRLA